MRAPVLRVRDARDEAGTLQPVEQANERNRPDVENLSEGGLIDAFVLRELDEDSASCASHPWKLAHLSIVATAPQPSSLVQQPSDRIGIVGVGIILGPQCRPGGRGLLQQIADGRFVRLVAMHKLLHDRLSQELIKGRLVGWGPSRCRVQGCAAVPRGRVLTWTVSCPADHYSTTI